MPLLLLRALGARAGLRSVPAALRPPPAPGRSFRYGGGRLALASPPPPPPRPVPPAVRCLLLAGPATGCLVFGLLGTAARCQEATVPVLAVPVTPEPAQPRPEPAFDWTAFWTFLRPQLLALSAAVVLALGAALLNVRIPVLLGQLVNVVARCARGRITGYLQEARCPALRLLTVYCLQGLLTFGYIALLARVGEQVAGSMRKALFISLLRQDVAFFDANRTGQLVNRLTADIQEFKSSFKLAISQGLRSGTQTAGCFVSLYLLSPKLTGLLLVALPTLVGAGALIGAALRSLSRQAQEQVAKATGVADEVLGNVRTVRAFAMEDQQAGLYCAEVDRAGWLNERLGMGIAAFQGLSNLALNGIVLGTIFVGGSLMAGDELSPGDLMSFLVASQTMQRSMANISILFGQVVRGLSAGARVFELLTLEPSVALRGGGLHPQPFPARAHLLPPRLLQLPHPPQLPGPAGLQPHPAPLQDGGHRGTVRRRYRPGRGPPALPTPPGQGTPWPARPNRRHRSQPGLPGDASSALRQSPGASSCTPVLCPVSPAGARDWEPASVLPTCPAALREARAHGWSRGARGWAAGQCRGAEGSALQASRQWRRCWSGSTSPRRAPSPWTATTSPPWTPPGCEGRSSASSARFGAAVGCGAARGCFPQVPYREPVWGSVLTGRTLPQEPVLFGTTIMENIRFGKPGASDAEVYAAAQLANADGFIRSFPEGYNTIVGERGTALSGGQKQRIAIARALLKDPAVLILDEATSALDAQSEKVVQEALDRAVSGRTVLLIAHRLSTIQGADLIVVLAQGRVAEAGTHEELVRRGGLYAELIRQQTKDRS
uniref:ATP binding cassette subfamily B member 8 n=1 Tax=Aquila chrysaetos chrysaetos TaxID=223781 RepID=A0A663DNH5_AQUCH